MSLAADIRLQPGRTQSEPAPTDSSQADPDTFGQARAVAALAATLDAVVTIDHRGHVLDFNRAAEETFGYRREDVLGRELAELIVPPATRDAHRRGLARWTSAGPAEGAGVLLDTRLEVVAQNARGEEFPVELAISRLDVEGPPLFTACLREISERRRSEERLRAAERRYRSLVEQLPLVVYVDEIAPGSPNRYSSPQVELLLGYPAAEWREDPELFVKLLHPDDRERVLAAHARIADGDDPLSLEYRLVARDGRVVWVRDEGRVVFGSSDAAAVLQGYLLDITAAKAAEERLRHQAFHDPLTGLPNRTFFKDRVEAALAVGRGVEAGMLIVDLDDFKAVNDRFGHPDGDELLCAVGERLRRVLGGSVLLARLGGDEFGVLIDPDDEPGRQAVGVARVVTEAFRSPFNVAGVEVFVTSSVGVAVGHDVDELFRQADVAMYRAKSDGKAHHAVYAQAMNEAVLGRLALIGELRRARVDEDFVVHYQPVVDLETGRVLGAEALLRWQHETRGIVSPADFIPAAEESGLIVPIGRFVLEEACRQAAHWRRSEPSGAFTVSVNVSVRQLQHPGFLGDVQKALAAAELEPSALVLEITERVVIDDPDAAETTLLALRRLGVGLALDDFGTGYSSLSALETLPVDALKLDRAFVSRMGGSSSSTSLVRAIASLATALGLTIVAEGIETERQVAALRELGICRGQGFYFHRPLEAARIEELLRLERQRRPHAAEPARSSSSGGAARLAPAYSEQLTAVERASGVRFSRSVFTP